MNSILRYILGVVVISAVAGAFLVGRGCGASSAQKQIADLSSQLATTEKTVEVDKGVYATEVEQMSSLESLLTGDSSEIKALKQQLSQTQADLLSTQQIVVQWKNAYEGELAANQSLQGKRERVDFSGKLGPIAAVGYTLTDPAEAHLSLRQVDPLTLTVSVARQKDGKWSSYVTSSDPNIDVKVNLAAVDPGVLAPTWKQRIWLNSGVDFLGGRSASLGVSYHFDRWSLGVSCSVWDPIDFGCGVTAGFQLFK